MRNYRKNNDTGAKYRENSDTDVNNVKKEYRY